MQRAIVGDCCVAQQTMHRFWFRRSTQSSGSETADVKASALSGSLHYAWQLFIHLACVQNSNFIKILEAVLFNRLAALVEGRTTLLDIINQTVSCFFHESLCTAEDMSNAKGCIECLLLHDNPCEFLAHIEFAVDSPTLDSTAVMAVVSDILDFDW